MKNYFGTLLLWLGALLLVYMLLSYFFLSATIALYAMRPVILIGLAIIVVLVGIYLRGDK